MNAVEEYLLRLAEEVAGLPTPLPSPVINEDWCKFAAGIMLCDISKKIVIPTAEEWIGLNLLERDDGLRRMH